MVRQPPPGKQPSRDTGLQAVDVYERAVTALQERRFAAAASEFRRLIDNFPREPELHERSRRYLAACERAAQPAPTPETLEDRLFAATLALNAGLQDEALGYLNACVQERPDSDHVQYMLAVAKADAGDLPAAATHLLRAIELNSDNRFLARTEPSFERLREDDAVRQALETPDAEPRPAESESPTPR